MAFFRQFGDANPNSIEASYYERTVNATYVYGSDHIDGDHHVYSLFYGISHVPVTNTRMSKFFNFGFFKGICNHENLNLEMFNENHTNSTGICFM
jgi:hypothetical protein